MKVLGVLIFCFALYVPNIAAQMPNIDNSSRVITMRPSPNMLKLDGVLDDEAWAIADVCQNFWMKSPSNQTLADPLTEVKVTYDDRFLYFGVKAYAKKDSLIVQSLKRDQGLRVSDGIGIVLDPVNLQTNGFYFALSPFNSQSEGLIGSGDDDIAFTWDNTWFSETKIHDDYWIGEIAIPFSILRYDPKKLIWGFNFIRTARSENEFHTWTNMPLQFRGTDLGYLGQMLWNKNPPEGGSKLSFSPYITSGISADPENRLKTKATVNAGFDAKVALSPKMNLDLTVNPDFSNVDVDVQVTNLTRFSIFFPERRIFFLENDDLFSSFGIPPIRPFYSRRIGSKDGQNVPILYGARITGNLNKSLRIGLLNVQTARKGESAADNFTSATFNQRILDRSTISGYFSNRTSFQNDNEKLNAPEDAYGRNAGLSLNYSNKEGTVSGWANGNLSFKPLIDDSNHFVNGGIGYFGQNFSSFIDAASMGKGYITDIGFNRRIDNYDAIRDTLIRVGSNFFYNETGYTFYPQKSKVNSFEIRTENFLAYDDQGKFNERNNNLSFLLNMANASSFNLSLNTNSVNLLFPFSFIGSDDTPPLPTGVYHFNDLSVRASTDTRRNFILSSGLRLGQFYGASYKQISVDLTLRKQPYFSSRITVEYNDLKFPSPYGQQSFWLIAPVVEVNFTNNLFWTSFLQFNSQANNFNINSRIQWRYKPMSDFFLVYSDNYFTDPLFKNKNRALVFKANYWINI